MEKQKKNKGITLIALVITIIVLLILAGITIAAITGQDSAAQRAVQARTENEIGAAKDAAALLVSEKAQEFYTKKYEKSDASLNIYEQAGEYVIDALKTEVTSGDYKIKVVGETIEVRDAQGLIVTGEVTDEGTVIWHTTVTPGQPDGDSYASLVSTGDVYTQLFSYKTDATTGKVDGVEEVGKLADTTDEIKVADSIGTAKIEGVNKEFVEQEYNSNYDSSEWEKTYAYYSGEGSGEHDGYYFVDSYDTLREIANNNDDTSIEESSDYNYPSGYYYSISGSEIFFDSHDTGPIYDAIDRHYVSLYNYVSHASRSSIAGSLYDDYTGGAQSPFITIDNEYQDSTEEYVDVVKFYTCDGIPYKGNASYNLVYSCPKEYADDSANANSIKSSIAANLNDMSESDYSYNLMNNRGSLYDSFYNSNNYREPLKYVDVAELNLKEIGTYLPEPEFFKQLIIPETYVKDNKEYIITEVDLSNIVPYLGEKVNEIVIPDTVKTLNLKDGYDSNYAKAASAISVLRLPGGLKTITSSIKTTYFPYGANIDTIILGEGITEISADAFNELNVQTVYLPKTLRKINGTIDNNIKVYYAGTERRWNKIQGTKPTVEAYKTTYTVSENDD